MGYMSLLATCFRCGQPFTCNPFRVPSMRIAGVRQPVCLRCVETVNPVRIAAGLDPIVPLAGAYEPAEEGDPYAEDGDD